MKIQRNIFLLFIAALFVIARFATHAYKNYKTNLGTSSWVNHTNNIIKTLSDLYATAIAMESDSRGYIITGEPSFAVSCKHDSALINDQLQALRKLVTGNQAQQKDIDTLSVILDKKVAFSFKAMALRDSSVTSAARQISGGYGVWLTTQLKTVTDSILKEEKRLLGIRLPDNKKAQKQALYVSFLGGAFCLVFLILFLYFINRDIQLRKRAEAELKSSEIKYRKLIEDAGVVMFTTNTDGHFTFISNRVTTLTGYQKEELTGKSFSILIPLNWVEKINTFYQEQFKNRTAQTITEFPIITKSGEEKWVEQTSAILYDDEDHIQGLQCMVKDIDEKRQMQMQLEKSEYRFESILANSSSLIYIKDLEGKYLLINRQFESVFHISNADIIGKTDYDFNEKEAADRYTEADRKVIETRSPIETEEIIINPDGVHYYLIIKFLLLNNENEVFGLCGIATDISQRVRNEQELEEARKIAENAEKLQEQFLANMSHDIRTPLNGIIGMTGLLKGTPLNSEQNEFTDAISQSAGTLLVLINDILDLSKIKAGMLNIESIPFRLRDIISTATYTLKQKAAENGVGFHIAIDPNIPAVLKGDPYRLSQILNNLVGNAVKFTDSGEISVSVLRETSGEEIIRVKFSVKDSGIGIPPDRLDVVFENFAQSGNDTARRYGGTGLGLAIVKQLVSLQGGDIHVESVLNKGSQFYFTIPYIICNADEIQPTPKLDTEYALPSGELEGYRLLITEDDPVNQKMISAILKKAGVQADMAGNGREMIDYLQSNQHYDLILSDIHMPEMDGYEAANFIRKNLHLDIPILAMTATVMQGEKENCLHAGMNDFISKPFSIQELLQKIRQYVHKHETAPTSDNGSTENEVVSSPLYDLSYLDEMEDNEYSKEVLQMFLASAPGALNEIKTGVSEKKWNEVYQKAHRLKSSAGLLKMQTLVETLTLMEKNTKEQKDLNEVPILAEKALLFYQTIQPMLEEEIKRLS